MAVMAPTALMTARAPVVSIAWMVLVLGGVAGCPGDKACEVDSECGGEVCARTHECLPESQVRRVQVRWTVRGEVASAATCTPIEPLGIQFLSTPNDVLKFEPLVCTAGLFTIDKMPSRLTEVRITGDRASGASGIPLSGQVQMDLR